ncbi:MAG: hypothetical protein JW994_03030 [Candidatus Omnitrophica bacterium]|nr:hypothetical protein [Candidatus Omnitrophota bacterium]
MATLIGLSRSGDAFLWFIGNKLHLDIAYKNHSGFIACFILRFMRLESAVFRLHGTNVTLTCREAYIEPSFDRFLSNRSIRLNCTLNDVSLSRLSGSVGDKVAAAPFLQANARLLIDKVMNISYDKMFAEIKVHGDTAEFPYCAAYSSYLRLVASGQVSESGIFSLKLKIFVSPKMAEELPSDVRALLSEESRDWLSYSLSIKNESDASSFSLESDKFRLNFETVEQK